MILRFRPLVGGFGGWGLGRCHGGGWEGCNNVLLVFNVVLFFNETCTLFSNATTIFPPNLAKPCLFTKHLIELWKSKLKLSHNMVEEMKTLQRPAKTGPTNGCRYKDTNFHSHGSLKNDCELWANLRARQTQHVVNVVTWKESPWIICNISLESFCQCCRESFCQCFYK